MAVGDRRNIDRVRAVLIQKRCGFELAREILRNVSYRAVPIYVYKI